MSDRPPPAWPIEPGRGIGPLRVGMPVDAAVRALDDTGLGPVAQAQKGSASIYVNRAGTVHLVPRPSPVPAQSAPDTVGEIELVLLRSAPPQQQPQAVLFGQDLLGRPLSDVQELLRSVDPRTERRGDLVHAPGLGVRVWSGGNPPHWPVESVTVTRPTPPARVVAASFPFAELDRVAQALGFTGGATTRRAPLVAGEPEAAEWSRRQVLLRYTFDPVSFLRVLRLDGAEAADAPVVQRLTDLLPLVTDEQVLADLDSDDEEAVLRAVQAGSVLRLAAARPQLRRLSQEAQEPLRTAARTALVGLPDPP